MPGGTTSLLIRIARAGEARALSELCVRSKAHWGYNMAFMQASAKSLAISDEMIAGGCVLVAEDPRGALLGVATAERLDETGSFDLAHFFIEPDAMRSGAGRALFRAIVQSVREAGGSRLMILADPHAVEFYERMGAARVGDAPSDAIPGRRLPLLAYAV